MADPIVKRPGQGSRRIDPTTLMRLQSLELRARTILEGFMQGLHRSPYHGASVEFSEYRAYTAGDDTRHIDWKLYARTDRYCIKKFEAETNLRCQLMVDLTRSMRFGSLEYTKADFAITLAATFSQFLFQQHDAVGLVTFDEKIREYLPPRRTRGHLQSIIAGLEKELPGTTTDVKNAIGDVLALSPRRSLIVLMSDLLAPLDGLETQLGYLVSSGHDVVVFQVLDPAEMSFEFDGPARFEDLESGKVLYIDPEAARESYRSKFERHLADIRRMCRLLGIDYLQVSTADSFAKPLQELLVLRSRVTRLRRHRKRS